MGNKLEPFAVSYVSMLMAIRALLILLVCALVPSLTAHAIAYELDDVPRWGHEKNKERCPKVPMVTHKGSHVRYHKPVRVYEGFKDKLVAMEKIVEEVAVEVYGRAPRRIKHIGTYNCRWIRGYPGLLSEHGLGNAIDVEGFDFGPAPRKLRKKLPKQIRGAFKVRLLSHFSATKGRNAIHGKFLRILAQRIIDAEIFRVVLGPSYPGHKNHFHFDMAPYGLVDVFP